MSNLDLWKSVEKTDEAYTQKAKKGAHYFTSISPTYQFKNATEVFGSYGQGWGIDTESEKFSTMEIGETILINYDAVLYYPQGKFPIHATEKLAYKTQGANGYLKIDDEARKKVVTNAITKGLSMLGFNADIFMGLFDDIEYVTNLRIETSIDKAENKDGEIEKQRKDCENFVISHFEAIERAVTINEAQGLYRTSIRSLERQKTIPAISSVCERGIVKIHKTFETKKGELDAEVV